MSERVEGAGAAGVSAETDQMHCARCHGDGWVLDEDLVATVCTDCDGIPTRQPADLAKALGALTDAYRGNRSPAYAGASNYVPIVVLEGLVGAEVEQDV